MSQQTFELDALPERFALCQLPPHDPLPSWISLPSAFVSATRTSDELSIVAEERAVPTDIVAERGFRALRVRGPLPLEMVGVMATLSATLANASVPIVPIGTVNTDYVFVQQQHLARAINALQLAGHTVHA